MASAAVNYKSFIDYIAKVILKNGSPESWMSKVQKPSQNTITSMLKQLITNEHKSEREAISVKEAFQICKKILKYLGKNVNFSYFKNQDSLAICSADTAKKIVDSTIGAVYYTYVYSDILGDIKASQSYRILMTSSSTTLTYILRGGGGGGCGTIIAGGDKHSNFDAESKAGNGSSSTLRLTRKNQSEYVLNVSANGGSGGRVMVHHEGDGVDSAYWDSDTTERETAGEEKSGAIALYPGDVIYASKGAGGDGGGGMALVYKGTHSKTTTGYHGKLEQDFSEKLFAGGGGGGGNHGAQGVSYIYPAGTISYQNGVNGDYTTIGVFYWSKKGENTRECAGCYSYGGDGGYAEYDEGDKVKGSGGNYCGGAGGSAGYRYRQDTYSWANGGGGGASGAISGYTGPTILYIR